MMVMVDSRPAFCYMGEMMSGGLSPKSLSVIAGKGVPWTVWFEPVKGIQT